jgi:twitching motility protein PilT
VNLLDSLLEAIARLDGDALVMHVGEKPYVVTTSDAANEFRGPLAWGQVELSSRVLTSEAVAAMLDQILPIEQRAALAEFGATEYDVVAGNPAERFTIVAAQGGEDVWLEVRRLAKQDAAAASSQSDTAAGRDPASAMAESHPGAFQAVESRAASIATRVPEDDASFIAPVVASDLDENDDVMTEGELSEMLRASAAVEDGATGGEAEPASAQMASDPKAIVDAGPHGDRPAADPGAPPLVTPRPMEPATPHARGPAAAARPPALVFPLSRPSRTGSTDDPRGPSGNIWPHMLHLAASRGATALYLVAQSAPMARVDGEFVPLEGMAAIDAPVIERLTAELRGRGDAAVAGEPDEWMTEVSGIGRVRCLAFRDHRGPGLIFRMLPRVLSADQLGLSLEIQALCSESDGLVLVAGGRRSGKGTLIAALVDLINRTRSDHVITVESTVEFVHDIKRSLISQRGGEDDDALGVAVRAAMREEPDVLVVDELRTPELVAHALAAADEGCLVFGAVNAPSTVAAVQRVVEMFPAERREHGQALLAGVLRGVVSLVLLRKRSGGRVAAREILLNSPPVAHLILEGRTSQLPALMDGARREGMVPFAETLADLVKSGTVHPAHAYRKAPNREQFLAALQRDGVDTEILERLA